MEFRDYAARETSALLARLLAGRAEASAQHLRNLREALEAAARAAEEAASSSPPENEIEALVGRLQGAAASDLDRVQREAEERVEELRAEAQRERERADTAESDLDATIEAHKQVDAARIEAEAATRKAESQVRKELKAREAVENELSEVRGLLEHARSEANRLSEQIESDSAQSAILSADLADARDNIAQLEKAHETLLRAHTALQRDHAALQASHSSLEASHAGLVTAHASLESTHASLEASHGALGAVHAKLEHAHAAVTTERDAAQAAHAALEGTHARLQTSHVALEATYTKLQSAHSALEGAHGQLQASHVALEGNYTKLQASHGALEKTHAALQGSHQQAEAAVAASKKELAAVAQARAAVDAELKELKSRVSSGSSESAQHKAAVEAAQARVAQLEAEIETRKNEHSRRAAELRAAEKALADVQTERETNAERLEAGSRRITALQRELDERDEIIRQLEARLNDSVRTEASFQQQTAGTGAELAGAREEIASLGEHVERLALLVDTSVRALDDLSRAGTVADLLSSLVKQLSKEFPRVALFRVKGNHLEGEQQLGFDSSTDVKKLIVPLTLDSLITRAASTGEVQHVSGKDLTDSNRAPFGGSPTTAIAMPLSFQGEPLAVVYADSDEESEFGSVTHDTSAGFARLLARHSTVLLTRLAQELKTLVELREYATMLLQEAEQIYAADLEGGKGDDDRRKRLKENLDYAKQLWTQRTATESAAAGALLNDQIGNIIQSQASTPFARDLAALTGLAEPKKKARKTAS